MANQINYHAKDFLELGIEFAYCKIVSSAGSTPRKKGASMLVTSDTTVGTVGGGKIEAETIRIARENIKEKRRSFMYHFILDESEAGIGMACGGDADVLIEYIGKAEDWRPEREDEYTAYIFGAGHVGIEFEKVLRYIGFKTYVFDDREEYANRMRFPDADDVHVISDFAHSFEGIETDENSYIFIVTRGHNGDLDVLRDALKVPSAYLGMIGSRKKNRVLYDRLIEEGFKEEDFAKIYSPIGLNIHSETPEEIAVAVAAEVIQVKSGHGEK